MNPNIMIDIKRIYTNILSEGQKQYSEYENVNTIKSAKSLETYSTYLGEMNKKLAHIMKLTENFAGEFLEKATEIRKYIDLNDKYEGDINIVSGEMTQGLSWGDMADRDDKKDDIINNINKIITKKENIKEYEYNSVLYRSLPNIYSKNIGFDYKIPIINRLFNI